MTRERTLDYHLARVLILLLHFAPTTRGPLHGLTKLAKVDFLLRYPSFLERLLRARHLQWPEGAEVTPEEMIAVESRMTRYKYGPWDDRYYPILGSLIGLGLVQVGSPGKTLQVQLTQDGERLARELSETPEWRTVDERAWLLAEHFDLTGNRLKNLIYDELPEAVERPHRVVI
jgi:hypothetical protein